MPTPADIAQEFQASRNDRHLVTQAKRLTETEQLLLVALLWRRGFHVMGDVLMRKLGLKPSAFAFVGEETGRQIALALRWVHPAPARPPVGPGANGAGAVVHGAQPTAGAPS